MFFFVDHAKHHLLKGGTDVNRATKRKLILVFLHTYSISRQERQSIMTTIIIFLVTSSFANHDIIMSEKMSSKTR